MACKGNVIDSCHICIWISTCGHLVQVKDLLSIESGNTKFCYALCRWDKSVISTEPHMLIFSLIFVAMTTSSQKNACYLKLVYPTQLLGVRLEGRMTGKGRKSQGTLAIQSLLHTGDPAQPGNDYVAMTAV